MAAPEDSDGISLGSEDSATSSSEHQSSEKAEGSTSFRNASEGGTGCLEGSESVLNDGYLTDNRYVHKDGREETWYQQKHWTTINPGPRGPPAAFLPGPLFEDQEDEEDEGPSCAEDHFPEPVPVVGEETEIAVAMTKVNDEAEAGAGAECTCASSSLARIYDDAPYFDHENGWWFDPGANDPKRSTFLFTPATTKDATDRRKRKREGAVDDAGNFTDYNAPLALSCEVVVPRCDLHYPVTGIVHDTSKFIVGSRFLKQVIHTQEITPTALTASQKIMSETSVPLRSSSSISSYHSSVDSDALVEPDPSPSHAHAGLSSLPSEHTAIAAGTNGNSHEGQIFDNNHLTSPVDQTLTAARSSSDNLSDHEEDGHAVEESDASSASLLSGSSDANDSDDGVGLATTHYIDQARKLRLIEDDPRNQGHRKMNIHAPPADWSCKTSVAKLNRWRSGFRERRCAAGKESQSSPLPKRWTAEELEILKQSLVRQLLYLGTFTHRALLQDLNAKWTDNHRSYSAVARTVLRYKLLEQARCIAFGDDGSEEREQAYEEAENGEADVEDNDDEEETDIAEAESVEESDYCVGSEQAEVDVYEMLMQEINAGQPDAQAEAQDGLDREMSKGHAVENEVVYCGREQEEDDEVLFQGRSSKKTAWGADNEHGTDSNDLSSSPMITSCPTLLPTHPDADNKVPTDDVGGVDLSFYLTK
ncbi:hypothetical protein B0J12DRAFT_694208 [Macrophomina phaseolina]|uniref:Uncharacterized protein n=1 Tax=Macrophomina phaseolina TaxID=35725 RepID=A0ABQ8GS32_9PEZI|nr:hypothetical protein B0J12DRAFT_694208 [Macrophomina phaseolina]